MFTYGLWLPFLREMAGLEGRTTFENVECTFPFTGCVRQGSVQTPPLWLKMAMQILWNVEEDGKKTGRGRKKRKRELHIETSEGGFHQGMQLYVGRQLLDSVSLEGALGADDGRIGGRVPVPARSPRIWRS